jgi:DNA/RNA endonuclease YhcR with UshA esterase domain
MQITPNKITTIGLTIGIIGLIALILLLPEPTILKPYEITKEKENQIATTIGTITNLTIKNGNAFFTITGQGNAKAFFYKPNKEQIQLLKEGKKIQVTGKIATYKGQPEIIIQKVSQVD